MEGINRIPLSIWLITATLLSVATAQLPYGYYTVLRIAICAFAGSVAVVGWDERNISRVWSIVFIGIAIMFNPIMPIYMKRTTWFYFDLIAAFLIFVHLFSMRLDWKKSD